MQQKSLSRWLIAILIGLGICGLAVYGAVLPLLGQDLLKSYPEFSARFWPWMIFLWLTAIPCFAVLGCGFKIAAEIGADRSFSFKNAALLKTVSLLAASDSAFFFAGNLVFLLLNLSHPSVVLGACLVVFVGVAIAVAAAVLSHLVEKAARMNEEQELTI
jgi:hypothetical protein